MDVLERILNVKRAEWANDPRPIEDGCPFGACRLYSRGYLRHLNRTGELLGQRLLTLHNLTYTYRLMADIRTAVAEGSFNAFSAEVQAKRGARADG